jgi:hypothetical protein
VVAGDAYPSPIQLLSFVETIPTGYGEVFCPGCLGLLAIRLGFPSLESAVCTCDNAGLETTLEYYVLIDADDLASELWANFGPATGFNETSDETSAISPLMAEQGGETRPALQPTYQG